MKFTHEKQDWSFELDTLTQKRAGIVADEIYANHKSFISGNGLILHAALEAEWLVGFTGADIDDGDPARILWMATEIQKEFVKLITIPKN